MKKAPFVKMLNHSNTATAASKKTFLNIHLGYSFNSIALFDHSQFIGGIPTPGRGIVGKNQSTQSNTTVRINLVHKLHWGGDTH